MPASAQTSVPASVPAGVPARDSTMTSAPLSHDNGGIVHSSRHLSSIQGCVSVNKTIGHKKNGDLLENDVPSGCGDDDAEVEAIETRDLSCTNGGSSPPLSNYDAAATSVGETTLVPCYGSSSCLCARDNTDDVTPGIVPNPRRNEKKYRHAIECDCPYLVHKSNTTAVYRHNHRGIKVITDRNRSKEQIVLSLEHERKVSNFLPPLCAKRKILKVDNFQGSPAIYFQWVNGITLKDWI